MILKNYLIAVLGFMGTSVWAGNPYNLIPEPESVKTTDQMTRSLDLVKEKKTSGLGKEGYILTLTPKGIEMSFSSSAGRGMALATIEQLKDQLDENPQGIPCGSIKDAPDFEWRGVMLDVGRYYYPMETLYKFIDAMHYYKYNVLHLHMTEDQGWRFPVPGYGKLRTIGAVRPSADAAPGQALLLPNEGMYTKEELQKIVAYCAKRGISVLPEIEMPGHNMALAASYPEFCCNGKGAKVWTHGGVSSKLICPNKPATRKFIKDVLSAVCKTFPFEYVHVGGDECPMGDWKNCPDCKKARAKKGQGDDVQAQMSDFTSGLTKQLASMKKKPILWYDIKKTYYHKGETVMSWLPGEFPRCIDKTKEQGINLIVTPQYKYYFARCQQKFPQGDTRYAPGGGIIRMEDCYNFDPRNGRNRNDVRHIKGINVCMWAEYIPSEELLMYMTFPRAIAVSETAWGRHDQRPSMDDFNAKLEHHKKRFEKRFGYTLERTPENKPYRTLPQEEIDRINALYQKGQQE